MNYYIIKYVNKNTPLIYARFNDYDIARQAYMEYDETFELVSNDKTEEISRLKKLIAKITIERDIAKYFRELTETKYKKVVNAFFNLKKRYDNRE